MRRLSILLILACLLPTWCSAQIVIEKPTERIEAGRSYLLKVYGLTAADLPKTIAIAEPSETTSVVGGFTWGGDAEPGEEELCLRFYAADNGRRFVAVIIGGSGKPTIASVTLEVGPSPTPLPVPPVPPPDPPIPPPLPGELEIVVVEETADRTPQTALVLLGLQEYLASRSLSYRLVDKDLKDGQTNLIPTWFERPREAALEKGLPCVVVGATLNGVFRVVVVEALPNTVDAAVAIIKRHEVAVPRQPELEATR